MIHLSISILRLVNDTNRKDNQLRSSLMIIPVGLGLLAIAGCSATGATSNNINSAVPEAQEDCEALRDSLATRERDNTLDAQSISELQRAGCSV